MKPPSKKQWKEWLAAGKLPEGTVFYIPDPWPRKMYGQLNFNHFEDNWLIARGLVCRTKTEAIRKAKAMIAAAREVQ